MNRFAAICYGLLVFLFLHLVGYNIGNAFGFKWGSEAFGVMILCTDFVALFVGGYVLWELWK